MLKEVDKTTFFWYNRIKRNGDFMLSVKSIKDNKEFLEKYFYLSSLEWGDSYKKDNFKSILNKRVSDVLNGINDNIILVLGLFDDDKLMGSLYKHYFFLTLSLP